jgi:hypothetical protein
VYGPGATGELAGFASRELAFSLGGVRAEAGRCEDLWAARGLPAVRGLAGWAPFRLGGRASTDWFEDFRAACGLAGVRGLARWAASLLGRSSMKGDSRISPCGAGYGLGRALGECLALGSSLLTGCAAVGGFVGLWTAEGEGAALGKEPFWLKD